MAAESANKGNYAEMRVMADCARRGYTVSIPFGHSTRYDLIVDRRTQLIRVQVKHVQIKSNAIVVKCTSNYRGGALYNYLTSEVDVIAAYEPETDAVYYVPMDVVSKNTRAVSLHLGSPLNNQEKGIRFARDFREL
jgi:hypothetical protein